MNDPASRCYPHAYSLGFNPEDRAPLINLTMWASKQPVLMDCLWFTERKTNEFDPAACYKTFAKWLDKVSVQGSRRTLDDYKDFWFENGPAK